MTTFDRFLVTVTVLVWSANVALLGDFYLREMNRPEPTWRAVK